MLITILTLGAVLVLAFYFHLKQTQTQNGQSALRDVLIRLEARVDDQLKRAEQTATAIHLGAQQQQSGAHTLQQMLGDRISQFQHGFENRQLDLLKTLQESIQLGMEVTRRQVSDALVQNSGELARRFDGLTQATDLRLQEISGQVERRLSEGFEKTTATFTDVIKRLALIDEAQKRITELSGSVMSLQEVLSDKRSRGAFGEVQLEAIVRNLLPETSFKMQFRLPLAEGGTPRIVDCMLFLPEPTGNIPVDAKFPLESFRKMIDVSLSDGDRKVVERQFKVDLRKHITDISQKYIVPGHTSDGAIMFLPAEAVFAEVHARHPDIVEEAQRAHVWLCSPTTLMAILTTARSVIKDAATRKQVHIIQEHLVRLSKDFDRFQKRMNDLATHIRQAHEDVGEVNISARKISNHFEKIERVDLELHDDADELPAAAAMPKIPTIPMDKSAETPVSND